MRIVALFPCFLLAFALLSGCADSGGVKKKDVSTEGRLGDGQGGRPYGTDGEGTGGPDANGTGGGPGIGRGGGNALGSGNGSDNGSYATGVATYQVNGSFKKGAEGDDEGMSKRQYVPFDVPVTTKLILIWVTWNDSEEDSPANADIDLYLNSSKLEATALTSDYEFIRFNKTANFTGQPLTWNLELVPFDIGENTNWVANILVFRSPPTTKVIKATMGFGENVDADLPGTDYDTHKLPIPVGTQAVAARLTWKDAVGLSGACSGLNKNLGDLDLQVYQGKTQRFASESGFACEFGYVAGNQTKADGGDWEFRVRPWLAVAQSYTLTIDYV